MGGRRLTRITADFQRVVTLEGKEVVLTFKADGITLRRLRSKRHKAVLLRWADLAREGGLLDAAELQKRPLLKRAFG